MLRAQVALKSGSRPVTHTQRPPLRPSRPATRTAVRCRASWLPDDVEDVLQVGTVVASSIAILGTAALAARSPKKPPPSDEEVSEFSIMTVVSCIPLFNWTAWILPAISNPDRAALYLSYAALYAYPLLEDGFDIEKYTILMLALGFAHVQVERIAQTEPQYFQQGNPLGPVLGLLGSLVEGAVKFSGSLAGTVASDTKQIVRGPGEETPQILDEGVARSVDELKEFDRRMLARDADKRRKKQEQKQSRW